MHGAIAEEVQVPRSTGRARAAVPASPSGIAPGMAQASLSTGSRSHLLPASRDVCPSMDAKKKRGPKAPFSVLIDTAD